MAGTDPLARSAAAISQLMNVDVEWASGIWKFSKVREVRLEDSRTSFYCSLNMEISFYAIQEGRTAVNLAEIFLMSEEVSVFTAALWQQVFLTPPHYLQQMTSGHEICCLQIESLEPAEQFVGRLLEAFRVLSQQVPVINRSLS